MADFKSVFKVAGDTNAPATTSTASNTPIFERIKADVEKHPVLLYMKGDRNYPQCGFSAAVVEVLNELGVAYETRDILADPELRQAMKEFSNWPTYPQLYIKGQFIGGCDITLEMHQHGELAALVK